MDDIIVRSRYPRHSLPNRRKKRYARESSTLNELIIRQLAISILLLIAVLIIRNMETPAATYLADKVKGAVTEDIELKNVFKELEAWAANLIGRKPAEENTFDEESLTDGALVSGSAGQYKLSVPVEGTLTSRFGERNDPWTQTMEMHNGIDIDAGKGASIKAALAGEVLESGSERTYGNYIRIKHDDGLETVYAHCSQLIAQKGQKVKQGDIIAKVGDTGASVGSHLHFEIWKDGKALDPLQFISVPSN